MGDLELVDGINRIRHLCERRFSLKHAFRALDRGITRTAVDLHDDRFPLRKLKQRSPGRAEYRVDCLFIVEGRYCNKDVCRALFPDRRLRPFSNDVHFGHAAILVQDVPPPQCQRS